MLKESLFNKRFKPVIVLGSKYIIISLIIRTLFMFLCMGEMDASIFSIFKIFGAGLFYDLTALTYALIPVVLFVTLIPSKIYNNKIFRKIRYSLYFIYLIFLVFSGFSEYFFWDEFGVRFNFIAVDYLVYTTEVIGNIRESYPLHFIFPTIALIAGLIMFFTKKKSLITSQNDLPFKKRIVYSALFMILPVLSFLLVDQSYAASLSNGNRYNKELTKNGIYSLFAAFRNNTLSYEEFYTTRDIEKSFLNLKKLLKTDNSEYKTDSITNIERIIKGDSTENRYNVMFITIESLSSKYLGAFGSKRGMTPHLDSLSKESMFFTNLYATGTRTVRGMESLTLSLPPTPGRSIVKRPGNENIFSSGFVFKEKGYDTHFVYGGYGYFDNMNHFYSNNGFDIRDRADVNEDSIAFANVWGISDEDLYNMAIKSADESYENGKPFMNFVMTTSNHRPFTYPEGRIDVPSGEGRHGAVEYTDYAVNYLLEEASKKPWFDNTIFVIVADHCGSSAGKTDLPITKYQIPLFIYAPKIITPKKIDKLCSQIDVMPTVFGLLDWSYESMFFGKDIMKMKKSEERALIGNYQKLGYVKNDTLTVLGPSEEQKCYTFNRKNGKTKQIKNNKKLINDAISYYQSASYMYENKLNRYKKSEKLTEK